MSWYNPTTWFLDQDNLEAGNKAYEKSQERNRDLAEQIQDTQGQAAADQFRREVEANSVGQLVTVEEAEQQIADAFAEGWSEAVDQRKRQFNDVVGEIFNLVPWTVWVAIAIAIFIWAGGPLWLQRLVNRKS